MKKPKYLGIKINIFNKEWEIRFYSDKRYEKLKDTSPGQLAVTLPDKFRIVIKQDIGPMAETIIHELVHAYMHMLCIKSTNNIDSDDLEEVYAEFMAHHGMELLMSAKEVYHDYLQLKEKVK